MAITPSSMPSAAHAIHIKLRPPQTVRDVIPRDRLKAPPEWIRGQYRLTTMVAPAGYGKSTVMSRWLAQSSDANHNNAAWLSLDESKMTLPA